MNIIEEKHLRIESATLGAEIALARLGLIRDEISQREAFRLFGEGKVRSWINAGYTKGIKGEGLNSKKTFSRVELQTIANLEKSMKLRCK